MDFDQIGALSFMARIVPRTYCRIICASERFLRKNVTQYLCTSVIRRALAKKLEIVVLSVIEWAFMTFTIVF